MQLILYELAKAEPLPFFVPIPQDSKLAKIMSRFYSSAKIDALPQQWAEKLHKSERSFSRFFRQQTEWHFHNGVSKSVF